MCRLLIVSSCIGEDCSLLPQTGMPMTTFFVPFYFSLPDFFPFSVCQKRQPRLRLLEAVVTVFPPSVAGARPEPDPVSLHRRSLKACYSINLLRASLKPPQLLAPAVSCGRELCHLTKCCVISFYCAVYGRCRRGWLIFDLLDSSVDPYSCAARDSKWLFLVHFFYFT